MITSVRVGIKAALKNDAEIQTILGGQHVFIGHIKEVKQIPSITILAGAGKTTKEPGYNYWKFRTDSPIVHITCWSHSSRLQTVQLSERIDKILVGNEVPNTRFWRRVGGGMDLFDNEIGAYYIPLHYAFEYEIVDS